MSHLAQRMEFGFFSPDGPIGGPWPVSPDSSID